MPPQGRPGTIERQTAVCPMTDKVCEGVAPSQASAWSEDMDRMQGRCAIELPYIQL